MKSWERKSKQTQQRTQRSSTPGSNDTRLSTKKKLKHTNLKHAGKKRIEKGGEREREKQKLSMDRALPIHQKKKLKNTIL